MTKSVTMTVKITRPDEAEIDALYSLLFAADEVDNRWSNETVEEFKERLMDIREGSLYDNEIALLLKAWDVLTNKTSGALGRLLTSHSTLVATFQDPDLDYVAASPAINKMHNDSLIYPELVEGFEDALRHNAVLLFELNEAKTLLRHTQEKLGKALLRNSQLAQKQPEEINGCKWVDWNELSERGLLKRINTDILHPIGLAAFRDPKTGLSAGALIAPDGKWHYPEES